MADTSEQPGTEELRALFEGQHLPAEKYKAGLALADALSRQGRRDQEMAILNQVRPLAQGDHQEAVILIRLADVCNKKSDFEGAVSFLEEAVVKLSDEPGSLELLEVYLQIATIYWRQGYVERARSFLDGAQLVLQLRQGEAGADHTRARAELLHVQAIIESASGNQEGAIKHYEEEIGLLAALGDTARLGTVYNNLSGLLKARGQMAAALEYQHKSMDLAEQTGEPLSIAISCNNLGEIYAGLGCFDKAVPYYHLYLEMNKRISNRLGDAFGLAGLGRISQNRGEYEKAEKYFGEALSVAREVKSKSKEISVLAELADLYCDRNRPEQAAAALDEAIRICIELELFNTQRHQVLNARILYLEAMAQQESERDSRLVKARAILEDILKGPVTVEDEDAISATDLEAECHALLACVLRAQGHADAASGNIAQAVAMVNAFAAQFPDDIRKTYLSSGKVLGFIKLQKEITSGGGADNNELKKDDGNGRR